MKLSQLGEERLLQQLLKQLPRNKAVVAGAGDDCAVVRMGKSSDLFLLKTDCVVQGVHFASSAKPRAVGWKAMARPLSDFAAMAGVPQFALVTLIAPATTTVAWVRGAYAGMAKAARAFEVAIVGGETSRIDGPIALSIAVVGWVEKNCWVSRSGGRAGDHIFVTGRLGGSGRGRHLRFVPRLQEARWLVKNFRVHAMMDLSDGLGADLPRLARASKLGFEIEEARLPRARGCTVKQAISDGEDYELLFAVSANDSTRLQRAWCKRFPQLPLTCIGRFNQKSRIKNQKFFPGYDHFQ